jgi:hypothetical protein
MTSENSVSDTRSVEVGASNPGQGTETSPEIVLHGRIRRGNLAVIGQTANLATVALLCVAVVVATHVFLRVAGTYPYFALDDSLANLSVTLSNTGVYGLPAVPVQGLFKLRIGGFYNYGPWPFYAGAALDWLFGTSYEIQRFLHPLCLFLSFAIAFLAFRRLNVGLAALYAWLVLALLWSVMWPMVRPDPFTALFVIAAIASATGGLLTERRRFWFLCSFFTFTAVTTHLVAAAVLPWAMIMLGLGILLRRLARPNDLFFRRFLLQRLIMVALGAFVAVIIFLEAIDFRVAEFLELATSVSSTRGGGASSYFAVIAQHFTLMWGHVPTGINWVVASGVACGVLALALLPFCQRRHVAMVLTYFAPPALMTVLYLLSLGAYPFYHSGYVLVGQVTGVWTAVAGFGVLGWLLCDRVAILGPLVILATPILAGIPLVAQASLTSMQGPNFAAGGSSIKFSRYYDEVLANVPSRALVFGPAIFGLESGVRHAFLHWTDANYLLDNMRPEARTAVAPDYLILNDYLRHLVAATLTDPGKHVVLPQTEYFPGVTYRQKKIVHAMPYGTTIVYERATAEPAPTQPPLVAVFDRVSDSWASELVSIGVPAATDRAPARFDLPSFAVIGKARKTKSLDLPAGNYLLELKPAQRGSGVFLATPSDNFKSNLGVNLNFEFFEAPFAPSDSSVFLLARHSGGPLYLSVISQKDGENNDFVVEKAWRVVNYQVPETPLPVAPLGDWTNPGKATLVKQPDGSLLVRGDDSAYAPQIRSPRTPVPRNTNLHFKIDLREIQGTVSVGVQNAGGVYWLYIPQARGVHEFTFNTADNDHVYFVVANLQPESRTPSEFVIAQPKLTQVESALDRIIRFFGCSPDDDANRLLPISGPPPEVYCKSVVRQKP